MFQTQVCTLCFTLKRVSSIKSEIINKNKQELIQSFYLLSCKSAQVRKINTELILKSKVSELKVFSNQRLTFSLFRRKVSSVDFEWWCNGPHHQFCDEGINRGTQLFGLDKPSMYSFPRGQQNTSILNITLIFLSFSKVDR